MNHLYNNLKIHSNNGCWKTLFENKVSIQLVDEHVTEVLKRDFIEQFEIPILREIKKVLDSEIYDLDMAYKNI